MKRFFAILLTAAMLLTLAGCRENVMPTQTEPSAEVSPTEQHEESGIIELLLSDDGITCDSDAVYTANDIIFCEAERDEYDDDDEAADAHSAEEAAAHTVVHITAPGTYRVSGTLSAGQLFIDLGEGAERDPNAVVTLILDNAALSCSVAPAILFYRVYECGSNDAFTLTPDLRGAGAVVELADGSSNTVSGSYVAATYAAGSANTVHEYEGAFYSRQSMRIEGSTGSLHIEAQNEGLCSELHLTVNGGSIDINAQNDAINTNAEERSVTTINGGSLRLHGGLGEEGDGIDSNGALVINGGEVYATANERSGDGGIDAQRGIYLNGGTVIASGSRNDSVCADSAQQYMELFFDRRVTTGSEVVLSLSEETVLSFTAERPFSNLTLSFPKLQLGRDYTLTVDGVIQQHGGKGAGFAPGFGDQPLPGIIEPIPDIGDGGKDGPPDVEIPPQPTIPLVPAGVEESIEIIPFDTQPPVEGQTPPQGGGFEAVRFVFSLTAQNHTFYHVCDIHVVTITVP